MGKTKLLVKAVTIVSETCCNCGVVFGLNQEFKNQLLENGKNFYCTNGHAQHFTRKKSLEKKLHEAQQKIESLECRIELCRSEDIYYFCDCRFINRLYKSGVNTIGDALKLGEVELRKIYGVGDVCIDQIKTSIEKYDINLK